MNTLTISRFQKRAAHRNVEEADRSPANPLHWMPVPFPGLTVFQLTALAQRLDGCPYRAPRWSSMRYPDFSPAGFESPELDRDPVNPLHWIPVPLPVTSPGQINGPSAASVLQLALGGKPRERSAIHPIGSWGFDRFGRKASGQRSRMLNSSGLPQGAQLLSASTPGLGPQRP